MRFHLFFALSALGLLASAHPGDDHHGLSAHEEAELHSDARACAEEIDAWTEQRRVRRAVERRGGIYPRQYTTGFSTATLEASQPHYTQFRNTTCVVAPDVTEGPYYVQNEFIRQDLREDHKGVTLELDIGVMDTSTCKPMPGVLVEIWGANATGQYSSFASYALPGMPPLPPPNPRMTDGGTGLRGGYPTNPGGLVALKTIYPGFYTGRTIHLHVLVHTAWKASTNGTLISASGNIRHVGQFYFEETWSDRVVTTSAYASNRATRTRNSADTIFRQSNSGGNSAIVGLEMMGASVDAGLFGYITLGVNSKSAARRIQSTNWLGMYKGKREEEEAA